MARVVALTGEQTGTCPGDSVILVAETDPPDSQVRWFLDGDETFPFSNTLEVGLGSVQKVVEAKLDQSVRSFTVPPAKVAQLGIEFDPPEPIGRPDYVITEEPSQPAIMVSAVAVGGPATALNWDIHLRMDSTFLGEFCPKAPKKEHDLVLFKGPAGAEVVIDFGASVRGGRLGVLVKGLVNGCPVVAARVVDIGGTNPLRTEIEAALPHNTLRAIACQESQQRQFEAVPDGGIGTCPLYGPDGSVGVMQIAIADATLDEVWDWRRNIARGIEIFQEKVAAAKSYPSRVRASAGFQELVDRFNERRGDPGPLNVMLPDFTTGNFENDLQQLEIDAIRGYDGWLGVDRFGFELHEWRVTVRLHAGEEILQVVEIDDAQGTGRALWERVPAKDRPIGAGDPAYVDGVLEFLGGCATNKPPCTASIAIDASGPVRSFSSLDFGAQETISAVVTPASSSSSIKVKWSVVPSHGSGEVSFDPPNDVLTVMRAGKPNRATIRAQVRIDGSRCDPAEIDISVPQFFHVVFTKLFDLDLEKLGLRRRPPRGGALTQAQAETNERVKRGIIDAALVLARKNLGKVNVRIMQSRPPVPEDLVTIALVGGSPADGVAGECSGKDAVKTLMEPNDHGVTHQAKGAFKRDIGNHSPNQCIQIFSGQIVGWLDRSEKFFEPNGKKVYSDIIAPLAVEDANGNSLTGLPVDAGEHPDLLSNDPEVKRRQLQVAAAMLVVRGLIGTALAHECGHALGLDHTKTHQGVLMDEQTTFLEYTGVKGFNPDTGIVALVSSGPVTLDDDSRKVLMDLLPIFS